MSFDDVTEGGSFIESGRYNLKIVSLELVDSQFDPDKKSVQWSFHCQEVGSGAVLRSSNGEPYEWRQWTSTKLTAPTGGGKATKGYLWACAFLGREIQPGDSGSAIWQELIGKKASGLIGPNENGNMKLLSIEPIKGSSQARATRAAAPEPEPEAAAAGSF